MFDYICGMKAFLTLLQTDVKVELRNKTALFGLVLYVVASLYLGYQAYGGKMGNESWGAFYWVVLLFGATQAAMRSFGHEAGRRFTYYYWLVSPTSLVLSKMTFNALLLLGVAFLQTALYALWFGWPVEQAALFAFLVFLGLTGTSFILTLTGAIAAKTGGNPTLMAILSFPLLLPQLLVVSKATAYSLQTGTLSLALPLVGALVGFCAVGFALGYLLFPYLWRD